MPLPSRETCEKYQKERNKSVFLKRGDFNSLKQDFHRVMSALIEIHFFKEYIKFNPDSYKYTYIKQVKPIIYIIYPICWLYSFMTSFPILKVFLKL